MLIPYAILLVFEIIASIAVLAAICVVEKHAFSRISHIIGEVYFITIERGGELITRLTSDNTDTVDTVFRIPHIGSIETIFTESPIKTQVTIFETATVI